MEMIFKKFSKLLFTVGSVLALGILLAGPASALDRKVNSGNVCQPNTGSQVSDFSYYSTGIRNNAAASRTVSCPVARDNTFNTDGLNYAHVYVVGTGTFSCYFDNVDNDGTLGSWVYNSRVGTGAILYTGTYKPSVTTSGTPYVFLCTLPTNGQLATIITDEY
jgi:hypothetical protein